MTETITVQQSIECPPWCVEPHGRHDVEAGDVVHRRVVAQSPWGPLAVEQSTLSDGVTDSSRAFIYVPADPFDGEMSAANARALAASLCEAADRLDEIEVAQVSA